MHERILVAGAEPVDVPIQQWTSGTPVPATESDARGGLMTDYWAAHTRGAVNLALDDMARAGTLDEAITASAKARIPTQNMLVVDASGKAAWTLLGGVPDRASACQVDAHDGRCIGWILKDKPATNGQIESSRLWTANNRVVDGATLAEVGDGGYALGARARQIRDDLDAKQTFTERDLLAIQLDDRALFLQRWWRLLQDTATRVHSPALAALASSAATWNGRAEPASASYRVVRAWRLAVHARLLDGLTAPAQAALGERFVMPDLPQFEGVAWPLVTQRPANLLPRRFASWDALFDDAARQVRDDLSATGPLSQRTWGEQQHRTHLSSACRWHCPRSHERWLCMAPDPLPGDSNMPRVAAPDFGASERMVVSPGHEVDGFIHMPGGQSGNPLSPYWGAGHEDWVHGRATPFLPGKSRTHACDWCRAESSNAAAASSDAKLDSSPLGQQQALDQCEIEIRQRVEIRHRHAFVDLVDGRVDRADLDALGAQRRDEACIGGATAGAFFRRAAGETRQHIPRRCAQRTFGRVERFAATMPVDRRSRGHARRSTASHACSSCSARQVGL